MKKWILALTSKLQPSWYFLQGETTNSYYELEGKKRPYCCNSKGAESVNRAVSEVSQQDTVLIRQLQVSLYVTLTLRQPGCFLCNKMQEYLFHIIVCD